MLNKYQRELLIAARDLIRRGKHEVIFFAIRSAFNAGTVEDADCDDVAALNSFINEDICEGIRADGDVPKWQRLNGMSRPGDGAVVADRLAWIERLLEKDAAHAE